MHSLLPRLLWNDLLEQPIHRLLRHSRPIRSPIPMKLVFVDLLQLQDI